ncbi:MAG: DNA polymerase Y family protein [Gammaproteobacteria bacterium]|nr:DNA polymerase Y family protein [Gammaproteobacteria bacterium]
MLWLALHFPMMGLEERLDTLDGDVAEPAVLLEDNRVVLANEQARDAEISLGSTLATANSILPELKHFNRDPAAEHERLGMLATIAYRYTPKVSPAPPDALLLEVRGSLRLFGGMNALVDELADLCRRLGHELNRAVATTPLAALMLARAGSGGASMGQTVAPHSRPGREAVASLKGVPLTHSDLPAKDLERLANMGITRIDELLRLPLRELGKRFGPTLIDYLARLTGQKADPRAFIKPPERFHSSIHLLEPVRGKDALLFPMRRLAAELARWLARRRFGTRLLIWTVKSLRGPAVTLSVEFAQPRRDDQSFLALSKLKLDSADMPEEAMSISLRADFIAPFRTAFADLWGSTAGGGATHAELVDLLAAKIGGEAVRGLRTVDDHRPELAWSTKHAGRWGVGASAKASGRLAAVLGPFRPMWLLDPPQPIDAECYELVSGPERIETGWWERDRCAAAQEFATRTLPEERDRCAIARDYYVGYSERGARCWLYREQLEQKNERWFLHGYFS